MESVAVRGGHRIKTGKMPIGGSAHAGRFLSAKQHRKTMRDLKVAEERLGDWQKEKAARIKKLLSQGYRVSS